MVRVPLTDKVGSIGLHQIERPDSWLIQPGSSSLITITAQLKIQVPAWAFADQEGRLVRKPVQLLVRWLDQLSSMIDLGQPTRHSHGLVDCCWQLLVGAKRAGKELRLVKPLEVFWEDHLDKSQGEMLQLMRAKAMKWRPLNSHPLLIWDSIHSSASLRSGRDARSSFRIDELGWWALGGVRLCASSTRLFSLRLKGSSIDVSQSRAIVLFPKLRTYLELLPLRGRFTSFDLPAIPGAEVLLYGKSGEKWWYSRDRLPSPWPSQWVVSPRLVDQVPPLKVSR